MKKLLLLLLPAAAFAQTPGQPFQFNGTLQLSRPVEMVFLSYSNGKERRMDSVAPVNGAFLFKGELAEPAAATLIVRYAKSAGEARAKREMLPLFLEPAELQFVAKDSLPVHSLAGSAAYVDYLELVKKETEFGRKLEGFYKAYNELPKDAPAQARQKLEMAMEQAEMAMQEEVWGGFVRANPGSPLAPYALDRFAGYDIDPNKVEPLLKSLPASSRALPSMAALQSRIDKAWLTAIGKPAPEFSQNNPEGQPVALSSFRGKYVLVDFWASWCGPCRKENPNLVKAYDKFKDRNFTVLGVSLDRPDAKEKWLAAIEKDGLTWTQVSDLKFWDNEAAKLYGIRAIPQNYLIDPSGVIIAKNLRGEALAAKLEELLSK